MQRKTLQATYLNEKSWIRLPWIKIAPIYYHRTSKGGESIDKDSLSKMGVKKWKRKQKDKDSSRGTSPSQSMATTVATSGRQ